ncbi:MAG: hypothetical protein H6607_01710 [Flavobacteriales bacterium]|nr:hypothetical protein [Flavobacteriales bacterium]
MEEIIEKYLTGTLSEKEKAEFEQKMQQSEQLKQEVKIQKQLMEAAKINGLKAEIENSWRQFRTAKMVKTAAISSIIVAMVALAVYHFWGETSTENKIENSQNQYEINNLNDTIIETPDGIILHIPAHCFDSVENYSLNVEEALTPVEIIKSGLSTVSDSGLLYTNGMFKITATNNGKTLEIAAGKQITAQIPADEIDSKMMLFDGVETNGEVKWTNPKPIKKHLINRSFDELDFYPEGFIQKLAENGFDINNRAFTDSLYFSFDCGGKASNERETLTSKVDNLETTSIPEKLSGKIPTRLKSRLDMGDDLMKLVFEIDVPDGYILYDIKQHNSLKLVYNERFSVVSPPKILNASTKFSPIINENIDYATGTVKVETVIKKVDPTKSCGVTLEFMVCNDSICFSYYSRGFTLWEGWADRKETAASDSSSSGREICPARIQALKTPTFANTFVATKEFEQRLKHIFKSCNEQLLNVYINHLDEDMWVSDSIAATMVSGGLGQVFKDFADQKLGNTQAANPAFAQLAAYHKQQTERYRKIAIETQQKLREKYAKRDNEMQEKSAARSEKRSADEAQNYEKELQTNLQEAYHQAGLNFSRNYYNVPIQTTGWKNLDQYVAEATKKRESLKMRFNNRDISIEYHQLEVQLTKPETYDWVQVYIIADSLPSYQKLKKTGEIYTEKLNELFDYQLVCVAQKGKEYFYHSALLKKSEQRLSINLNSISEDELKAKLNQSTGKSAWSLTNEINFLGEQFKYNKELETRKKAEELRRELEQIIWPCGVPSVPPYPVENIKTRNSAQTSSTFDKDDEQAVLFNHQNKSDEKKDLLIVANISQNKECEQNVPVPRSHVLLDYLKQNYPKTYSSIELDFDINDSTLSSHFQVNYCNFKRTPMVKIVSEKKSKDYVLNIDKVFKGNEFKMMFALAGKDCACD